MTVLSTTFWIQLLGVIFSLSMLYFTYVKFKRKEINKFELSAWSLGWIALIITAIAPSSLDFVISPLNFYRRLDFYVVIGFFVLLGMGFYNYSTLKKMERKLEVLVRKTAHNDALQRDTLQKNSLEKDTLEKDTLEKDTLEKDTLEKDTLEKDKEINAEDNLYLKIKDKEK